MSAQPATYPRQHRRALGAEPAARLTTTSAASGPTPDHLPVALRAFTETPEPDPDAEQNSRKPGTRGGRAQREDRYVLVLDTETTTCQAQRLTFGVYRYYRTRRTGGKLYCVDEGIFHSDELPGEDPDGYRLLRKYAKYREPAVDWTPGDSLTEDAAIQIQLLPASEMRELLHAAAYRNRALVVCFNLPFDLSRLATDWTETRGGKTRRQRQASSFAGGFTLRYFEHDGKPNRYRPELRIKTIDSKRALKQFSAPHEIEDRDRTADGQSFRGHLLDLRTIAFALTDKGHSLESACEAFKVSHHKVLGNAGCERRGIPTGKQKEPYKKQEAEHGKITPEYIDYCRDDVAATAKLYEAVVREYRRHPISLQITKAFSPASIGKSYLDAMGVRSRRERQADFPRDVLGKAMSAYYGGRAECLIRRVAVPVVYLDFLSMYPTVNALMGLWQHVTAARIEVQDATAEVRTLVSTIDLEACLNPATWQELPALVQIKPADHVLPVRARYGNARSWGIGSNPLWSDEPMWYALPDVIASKLITGKTPEIIQAIRLVPVGRQRGLRSVKLRGEVEIDPLRHDLFRAAIEQRRQLDDKTGPTGRFLKTFATGTGYGIYAEMNRRELPGGQRQQVTVYGLGDNPFTASVTAPEQPGAFAFPPMAACITAAARLMLATLETLVTQARGTWAFCDTDSMAIVATQHGGLVPCPGGAMRDSDGRESVRALSWAQVDEIVQRFESLNPYDRQIVPGSVLEIEAENYGPDVERRQLHCYSISAKRYTLYNLDQHGQPILRKITDEDDAEDDEPADSDEPTDTLDGLRKHSEHGLGHLLNPTNPENESRDWIVQLWQHIIRIDAPHQSASDSQPKARRKPARNMTSRRPARGQRSTSTDSDEPDWLDRPALTRTTITSPRLLKPSTEQGRKRPAAERIRPYNFLLVAHVANPGLQNIPERFLLIAPYESDPRKWRRLPWTNAYEPGSRYKIVTDDGDGEQLASAIDGRVIVKTYRSVLADHRTHPEAKSLGPDGQPCNRATVGLLSRRPVKAAAIHHIGKESNKIEEAASGLVTDLDDAL
ncbi:MAG: DNA polymerase, partial [Solirubrobacteraceae bacterium]